jgi:CRP/FNR family cyclic AMP-dependent transcriptional regulator
MADDNVLDLCADLPVVRYGVGEVMIAEGPASDRLLILVSGRAEVLRGTTQVSETGEPGAIFGEISALLRGPHTATVRAVTDVAAHELTGATAALRRETPLTWFVARLLAQRLVDATGYLADIKRQFADRTDHLGMVDEVLDTLIQRQRPAVTAGSELKSDPRL